MAMKKSEMREMDIPALRARLLELRSQLAKERAALASGTRAEKPATIRNIRHTIARVLTAINEKMGR